MKKLSLLLLVTLLTLSSRAQLPDYYISNSVRLLKGPNDTIPFPFTGGFVSPQFSEIDLNNDGIRDLFILDRSGAKVTCYLNRGIPGLASYIHAPHYEAAFPKLIGWALLRDYNCDGKEDIFTGTSQSGLAVYKNTSSNGELSFELFSELVSDNEDNNISIALPDIPDISDVDGDGDLDILSFPSLGGNVYMYRNQQKEENLPCDSLRFKLVDYCWGTFGEGSMSNSIFLGAFCIIPKDYSILSIHSGSTLLTMDLDNDQDMDLLLGDVEYPDLLALVNGKVDNNWPWDTIISYSGNFPSYDVPASIEYFPAAYYLDLNNDGKKDLIISSNDALTGKNLNQVWMYENKRATNHPDFRFTDSSFLQAATLDLGGYTSPCFFDADADGHDDLVLAYSGNYRETNNQMDRLALFRKTRDSIANFELVDADYLNLSGEGLQRIHPCFYDMNDDGLSDLLLGQLNGKIRYYQNTGSQSSPAFTFTPGALDSIDVGILACPAVFDMNADSLPDLVIGTGFGPIHYFQNQGTANSPQFGATPDVDTLWKIWVNNYNYQYEYDTAFPYQAIDSIKRFSYSGSSSPAFYDLTGDGKAELICGSENGKVYIYPINPSNLRDSLTELGPCLVVGQDTNPGYISIGKQSKPAMHDANKDNIPDFFVGNSRGGIHYFQSTFSPHDTVNTRIKPKELPVQLGVWPNPGTGIVRVSINKTTLDGQLVLFDLMGKQIKDWPVSAQEEGRKTLDLGSIQNGSYLLSFISSEGQSKSVKITLIR